MLDLTLGVEEEFLLLDPGTLEPAAAAARLRGDTGRGEVHRELAPAQIESATEVCRTLEELHRALSGLRRELAADAAEQGCRLASVAVPPLGSAGPPPVTDSPRYRRMYETYGSIIEDQSVCGCHVHVGALDLETALVAGNHLRPWLPALLLLTTNSPFFRGCDTGYASWRTTLWSRWPAAGPPPVLTSARHYHYVVDCLLASGAVLDSGMLYWYARPSHRVPTLEVRVADAAATVDEAVLLAGLVRGLVGVALSDRPEPVRPVEDSVLRAACWCSAHHGLEGFSLDVGTGRLVPSWRLVDDLVEHVRPVLERYGDLDAVHALLGKLRRNGSAAHRQREVFRRHRDIGEVVEHVLVETVPDENATLPGRSISPSA
ncbi:glutamate--cysteine ligase [Saccharopolyspora erythraea]|uniref:carboxylate-amine ligase n=1 Tax=Saccharopolyspora erythraea TaxID=1836 RepID=UPI001BAD9414|nr:glutamate--cysteine ligase [Saccharopolyspora erythraea]QUH03551.1 glutamate--cysteine ligase [Saccharopolyspora erythraea]